MQAFRAKNDVAYYIYAPILTLGNNIDILKIIDIFVLLPILSLSNKLILMATSS